MDTEMISAFIDMAITAGPIFAIFATFSVAVLIWWRTGSSTMILERLWRFFHGTPNACNATVKEHLDAHADAMRLRFSTGARVRTLQHALRVIEWSDRNDESIRDAAACGQYFDFELPGLNEKLRPSILGIFCMGIFAFSLALCAAIFGIGMIPERALLKLNQTDTWLTMNEVHAKPFSSEPGFLLERCGEDYSKIPQTAGFTPTEIRVLCDAYRAEDKTQFPIFLKNTIREQRWAFGVIVAFSVFMALPLSLSTRNAARAYAMWGRLRDKAARRDASGQPTNVEPSMSVAE